MTHTETPQTVTLAGRVYTFTTEDAEERDALSTLGSLFNSRGKFYGYVVRDNATGVRAVITTARTRTTLREERAALATLSI
jgi:hypothetical protein